MIKDFMYNDIVLYCKGWYQKDDNMLEDLGYLFSKIYAWTPKTEKEIAPMMLRVLDEFNVKSGRNIYSLYSFFSELHKYMSLYDISLDKAIILYVRSILQSLSKDEIKLNAPHYGKKEYFRMGSLWGRLPISMTYTEMNRIANRMFNK